MAVTEQDGNASIFNISTNDQPEEVKGTEMTTREDNGTRLDKNKNPKTKKPESFISGKCFC